MWQHRCELCLRRAGASLCQGCWGQITPLDPEQQSFLLQASTQAQEGPSTATPARPHIAYAAYASPLKQLLYTVKYHSGRELAYSLGIYLGQWYLKRWPMPDLLVPVPLHPTRRAQRGYNQAEELARGLAEVFNRPYKNLLERSVDTPALYELSPAERQAVLQNAFSLQASHSSDSNKRLLLVDDIVTTGSTIIQAAQCLQPISAKIVSLSLARALLADTAKPI